MFVSFTLSRYIGRQFLIASAIALGGVLVIAGMIDIVELFRRTAERPNVPASVVLEMVLLRLPNMAERILPYGTLIGAMIALTRLTRTQELIVARAGGVSVWQFLMPAVLCGLSLGMLWVVLFNPIAAATIARFDMLENRYIRGNTSLFSVSDSGLWVRQVEADKQAVIFDKPVHEYILRAARISQSDMTLHEVTIFGYGPDGRFIGRIDAQAASLRQGYWQLEEAKVYMPGMVPQDLPSYQLQTDLEITHIQDSFADPETLSFWELSGFIHTLEKAGFSALRHKLTWHSILATPLMLSAMVLIAAVFSLRLHRRGRIGLMIVSGILSGFIINFFTSLFHAFGQSGSLPVPLAAWAPPALALMIGTALLLHLEDG
jgi:lipopolysaccharide export system permease protein